MAAPKRLPQQRQTGYLEPMRYAPPLCRTLTLALLLVLLPGSAWAEFYKYLDRSGRVVLSDRPPAAGERLLWRSRNDPRYADYSRIDLSSMERNRRRYAPLIDRVARDNGLPPELLHALVRAESAYDPRALSKKGARGLMQLMPATARRYGVADSWDPEQNLRGGARYLSDLLQMFDRDLELAVAAYNAGENAVKRFGNRIPPYDETRDYVRKVVAFYQQATPRVVSAYPTAR